MRILFLDLDGTVRYSLDPSGFINKPEDVAVYPEATEQMARFVRAGWKLAFVSNQGGIARGFTTHEMFIAGLERTEELLGDVFDGGAYCPHDPDANCGCRKPRAGMVMALVIGYPVNLPDCLFVGDRPEDELCAAGAGIPFMRAEDWRAGKADVGETKGEIGGNKGVEEPSGEKSGENSTGAETSAEEKASSLS